MFSIHPRKFTPKDKYGYANFWESKDQLDHYLSYAMLNNVWSPIVWNHGKRNQDNFVQADWLVLDFDQPNEELTLQIAKEKFADMTHILGTTKSHQKDKGGIICDRFRLCLKFEYSIKDLTLFRWNMKQSVDFFKADKACVDGARFYYPCMEIIQEERDGCELEVSDVPKKSLFNKPVDLSRYKDARIMPSWIRKKLTTFIPQGSQNTTCYQLSKDLTKLGFDENQIRELIFNSPTFKDGITEDFRSRIKRTIRDGMIKATAEKTLIRT